MARTPSAREKIWRTTHEGPFHVDPLYTRPRLLIDRLLERLREATDLGPGILRLRIRAGGLRAGNDINFGPLASTKMAGPPEAMKRETRFLHGLESAAHAEVRNETMTLSNDNDVVVMLLIPAAKS